MFKYFIIKNSITTLNKYNIKIINLIFKDRKIINILIQININITILYIKKIIA